MALTEMIAKKAVYIMQDVFDHYRLWAFLLSQDTVRFSRELNLLSILGAG